MASTDNSSSVYNLPPTSINDTHLPNLAQNFTLQTTTAIIEATGLLGNALVIFVILRTKSLRCRLPNQFIINQSVIDFCSCISLISFVLPKKKFLSADDPADQLYCKLIRSHSFSWGFVFSSTYSLIALTIERYLSVVHPIWHKEQCTKKKAYIVMILTWFFGLIEGIGHAVPTSYIENGICYTFSRWPNSWVRSFAGVITCTLHYILPIAMLMFLYGKMIMVITGRIKKVAPLNPPPKPQVVNVLPVPPANHSQDNNTLPPAQVVNVLHVPAANHSQDNIIQPQTFNVATNENAGQIWPKAKRNVIHTLALVSVLFALCWSMNQIYYLMMCLGYPPDFSSTFYNITVLAIYLNSCINPIVYFVKYDQFKKATIKVLCLQ